MQGGVTFWTQQSDVGLLRHVLVAVSTDPVWFESSATATIALDGVGERKCQLLRSSVLIYIGQWSSAGAVFVLAVSVHLLLLLRSQTSLEVGKVLRLKTFISFLKP